MSSANPASVAVAIIPDRLVESVEKTFVGQVGVGLIMNVCLHDKGAADRDGRRLPRRWEAGLTPPSLATSLGSARWSDRTPFVGYVVTLNIRTQSPIIGGRVMTHESANG